MKKGWYKSIGNVRAGVSAELVLDFGADQVLNSGQFAQFLSSSL